MDVGTIPYLKEVSPTSFLQPPSPQEESVLSNFPHELIYKIIRQTGLEIYDLSACRGVCVEWRVISNLKEEENFQVFDEERSSIVANPIFLRNSNPDPLVRIFGKRAWKRFYGFNIEGDIPPLPSYESLVNLMESISKSVKRLKEIPACSLMLIPKGLSLNVLKNLVENPLKGINKTKFRDEDKLWDDSQLWILEKGNNVCITYWALMTNGVIEGTLNQKYRDQLTLIKTFGQQWSPPTLLEASVCCFMNFASSGKYIFGQDPPTFSCCWESPIYSRCVETFVVGDFALGGLQLYSSRITLESFGMAACLSDYTFFRKK